MDHTACGSSSLLVWADMEQVLPDLTLVVETREQRSLFTMFSVTHGCVSPQQTCMIRIRWESVPVASHSEHNPGQVRSIQGTELSPLCRQRRGRCNIKRLNERRT